MHFFGPPDKNSVHTEKLVRWKVKMATNDEMRQQFFNQYVPKILELGLTIPDPELKKDPQTGQWAFGDPDWENDPYGVTFPGGETIAEFQIRIGAATRALIERVGSGTAIVFCHGGVVDTVLRQALRTSGTGIFEIHTKNTSITEFVIVRPGRSRLVRYNDAAHTADLPASTNRPEDF
jgi:hypothetical protein